MKNGLILLLAIGCLCLMPIASTAQGSNYTLEKGFDTSAIEAPQDMHETDWSAWLATQMQLDPRKVCEVRTFDKSRVDILTDSEAIEVEWSKKWKESIGQSLLYSIETNREPGVILLSRGDDLKYLLRCQIVCHQVGIRMRVQRVPELKRNLIVDP